MVEIVDALHEIAGLLEVISMALSGLVGLVFLGVVTK